MPMPASKEFARVAYSPLEFAALFGKSQTWGYRQIYAGKVIAISEHGRILIPAKEVERILETAGIYNGREKPLDPKKRLKPLTEQEKSIWQRFVETRRGGKQLPTPSAKQPAATHLPNGKDVVLARVAKSWNASRTSKTL